MIQVKAETKQNLLKTKLQLMGMQNIAINKETKSLRNKTTVKSMLKTKSYAIDIG